MDSRQPNKIWLAHVYNDRSGSPRVLKTVALCLLKMGMQVHICTSYNKVGLLSNIDGVKYHYFNYKWSNRRFVTLLRYLYSQLYIFFLILRNLSPADIVYCNTLLPAGASIAAKIRGAKIIYHIHELSVSPKQLDFLLKEIIKRTASEVLFVSEYLQRNFNGKVEKATLLKNCFSAEFEAALNEGFVTPPTDNFVVTLACSLKAYKGIYEFAELAKSIPDITFLLASSAPATEVDTYLLKYQHVKNLTAKSCQINMVDIYRSSHVVINLSRPDQFVETFGLTIIEAMACGRPVIAPAIGGPMEIINHGVDGFLISSGNLKEVYKALRMLKQNKVFYSNMCEAALVNANNFRRQRFCNGLASVIYYRLQN